MNIKIPGKRDKITVRLGHPRNLEIACAGLEKYSLFGSSSGLPTYTTQFLHFTCLLEPRVLLKGSIPSSFSVTQDCPHCGKTIQLKVSQQISFDGTVDAVSYRNAERLPKKNEVATLIGFAVCAIMAGIACIGENHKLVGLLAFIFAGCFFLLGCLKLQKLKGTQNSATAVDKNPRFMFTDTVWPSEIIPVSGIISVELAHVSISEPQHHEKLSISLVKNGEDSFALGEKHMLYAKDAGLVYSIKLPIFD